MGEGRKLRSMIRARSEGRRARGRTYKTYNKGTKEIERQNGTGMSEMRKIVSDRREWQRCMDAVPTL